MSALLMKENLDVYWDNVVHKALNMRQEEILFFTHCTTVKGRRGISFSNTIKGYPTDMPHKAPLARNMEIEGVWFETHSAKLPTKSPYGNRRLTFTTKSLMKLLSSIRVEGQGQGHNNNENIKNSNLDNNKREHSDIKEKMDQSNGLSLDNHTNNDDNRDYGDTGATSYISVLKDYLKDGKVDCASSALVQKSDTKTDPDVSAQDDIIYLVKNDVTVLDPSCTFEVSNGSACVSDYGIDKSNLKSGNDKKKVKRNAVMKAKGTFKDSLQLKNMFFNAIYLKDDILHGRKCPVNCKKCKDSVKVTTDIPCLFLENCHFYGNQQYLRFVLINNMDKSITWCNDHLKRINFHDNPVFKYNSISGRLFSRSRQRNGKKILNIHVLVVGNIELDLVTGRDCPNWDKVTKIRRAGREPVIGIVPNKH